MDMSLQEYLNHETLRLKKDRTKLNESTRLRNNSNRLFDEIINEKNNDNKNTNTITITNEDNDIFHNPDDENREYMNTLNKKGNNYMIIKIKI
jgi:hypothetical protein